MIVSFYSFITGFYILHNLLFLLLLVASSLPARLWFALGEALLVEKLRAGLVQ